MRATAVKVDDALFTYCSLTGPSMSLSKSHTHSTSHDHTRRTTDSDQASHTPAAQKMPKKSVHEGPKAAS